MRWLLPALALFLVACSQSSTILGASNAMQEAEELSNIREENARASEPNQAEYDEAVERILEEYPDDLDGCYERYPL